ncbi:hypothetical protein [Cupriavidus yeoncheonensis]|nr:hypothetical protein [Cupriavidus yeoncheonensis]
MRALILRRAKLIEIRPLGMSREYATIASALPTSRGSTPGLAAGR